MKVVLAAINAKYIHSNLAVYSLRAYARKKLGKQAPELVVKEYTINQTCDEILGDLYREGADLLAVSCYLWNIAMVEKIVPEYRKLRKETAIWYGGPEVSYHAGKYLKEHPYVDGIMVGEGEEAFTRLIRKYMEAEKNSRDRNQGPDCPGNRAPVELPGLLSAPLLSMDELPFPYEEFPEHKILYYETSRGCPFSCSYCLSSVPEEGTESLVDAGKKRVRLRSISMVEKELSIFLEAGVTQVKFIDRTFNCNKAHAMAIWQYIYEHDNGITNFHFEVAADLLDEEELLLLSKMRKGLVQLEIGIQSTNMECIQAVSRKMNLSKVKENVERVQKQGNIHQHLDLIAGLPYEDYDSFCRSFDEVYQMQPQQLQLGFLKVLKGTRIEKEALGYREPQEIPETEQEASEKEGQRVIWYREYPPYEVLKTKWISYEEILRLKDVEEMVEAYYNSGQFKKSVAYLLHFFDRPYAFYDALAGFYRENGQFFQKQSRLARYEMLLRFGTEKMDFISKISRERFLEILSDCLTFDWYAHENAKSRPRFSRDLSAFRKLFHAFYEEEARDPDYLTGYPKAAAGQLARMTHMEVFSCDPWEAAEKGTGKEVVEGKEVCVLFEYQPQSRRTQVHLNEIGCHTAFSVQEMPAPCTGT